MDGIVFGESPRWHDGRLWFSDWGAGQIWSVTDGPDGRQPVLEAEVESLMCIDFLPDGRLLAVSPAEGGRVLRREPDGSMVTHADLSTVLQVGWNDIVVDDHGRAYVNSIAFDFPEGEFRPGLVVLVDTDGSVRTVADGLAFPNGMAISPDGSTLVVAESYGEKLTAYDIAADGSLGEAAHLGEDARGPPRRRLLRRLRRTLVRRRRQPALRPAPRGRRGARHRRLRPRCLRVCVDPGWRTEAAGRRPGVG